MSLQFWIFILLGNVYFLKAELTKFQLRHEYKLTFKKPYILPPNSNEIPFFETGGHVITGKAAVRLTTSLSNQQGWLWSKNASNFIGFQIDVSFKIKGRGRVGADGLAVWVTKEKSLGGLALGGSTIWKGLGLLLDTYDNNGEGDSPIILAVYNDGTKLYNADKDGRDIAIPAGHCIRQIRNRPFAVQLRIIYVNGKLTVMISSGLVDPNLEAEGNPGPLDLETCFSVPLEMPREEYFFGLSSATGSISDDHDVEKFEVHSFQDSANMKDDELKKIEEEKKKYEEEFKKDLDEIKKTETPNQKTKTDGLPPNEDSIINQNLIIIYSEMAKQHTTMRDLMTKTESMQQSASSKFLEQVDSMRKELLGLKSSIDSLQSKVSSSNNAFQMQQNYQDLHNSVDNLKTEIMKSLNKMSTLEQTLQTLTTNQLKPSDSQTGCISSSFLISVCLLQVFIIIGFLIYQKNKDAAAKKFY